MDKEEARKGHISLHLYAASATSDEIIVHISHNNSYIIRYGRIYDMDMLVNLIRSHAYSCGLMVMTKNWLTQSYRMTVG